MSIKFASMTEERVGSRLDAFHSTSLARLSWIYGGLNVSGHTK